jgi:hypothetical protein
VTQRYDIICLVILAILQFKNIELAEVISRISQAVLGDLNIATTFFVESLDGLAKVGALIF